LPMHAMKPEEALWDPGFAGLPGEVPINGYVTGLGSQAGRRTGAGNTSYAHAPAFAARKSYWRTTGSSREPVMCSRGPSYQGSPGAWRLDAGPGGVASNRVQMFGAKGHWNGNVGFNDGHLKFESRPDPDSISFAFDAGGQRVEFFDNLFVNEDERRGGIPNFENIPSNGSNALLQMFGNVSTRGPYIEGQKDVYLSVFKD